MDGSAPLKLIYLACSRRETGFLCHLDVLKMSSGLLEPPAGGEQLCVFLLRDGGDEEEAGVRRRKEVACQWERPEEACREVGCQSDPAERRDAGVQVDLLTQQLSWRHSGETWARVCRSDTYWRGSEVLDVLVTVCNHDDIT